jgi:RNA chaperone Hfq
MPQRPLEFENRVQEPFLNELRKSRRNVHVYLRSGARLEGVLASFDAHMIQIRGAEQQTIYKHEIVSILRAPFGKPKAAGVRSPGVRSPAGRPSGPRGADYRGDAWQSALGQGDGAADADIDQRPRREPVVSRKPTVVTRVSRAAAVPPAPEAAENAGAPRTRLSLGLRRPKDDSEG